MTILFPRRLVLMGAACLLLNACASHKVEDTIFADGPRGAVSLQSVGDYWFKTAHPLPVSPLLLSHVLRGLQIQALSDGQATAARVFSDEETAFLSSLMSTALSKATKSQLVAFRVVRDREGEKETTGGMLYLQGRLLHLALTHYRASSAGTNSGAMLDRKARNPKGLEARQLRFSPEAVRRSTLNEQPDVIDPPPVATLVIDYNMLVAELNLPSESTQAQSSHSEAPSHVRTEPQAAQPEPGIPGSQEPPSAPAQETQALKKRVKEQAIELDALKEDVRALRNRLSEMEAPSTNQTKPPATPR